MLGKQVYPSAKHFADGTFESIVGMEAERILIVQPCGLVFKDFFLLPRLHHLASEDTAQMLLALLDKRTSPLSDIYTSMGVVFSVHCCSNL